MKHLFSFSLRSWGIFERERKKDGIQMMGEKGWERLLVMKPSPLAGWLEEEKQTTSLSLNRNSIEPRVTVCSVQLELFSVSANGSNIHFYFELSTLAIFP